jgi:hypothetical protein
LLDGTYRSEENEVAVLSLSVGPNAAALTIDNIDVVVHDASLTPTNSKARQMHSDGSTAAPKKRKRSESPDGAPERQRTLSIIRRSIALLTAIPEIPAASLHPLLNTLTDAYGSALSAEARDLKPPPAQPISAEEDWNWELTTEQIARLSEEELTIWKDLLPCRHNLRLSVSF